MAIPASTKLNAFLFVSVISMANLTSTHYNPKETEARWYAHWMEKGYFKSTPDDREPYTIVIPPPNVTGVLHMGHMLNNTIQDALIRKARLDGKNACWVPGTDHASIATEAKVVGLLRERGIKKSDLSREEFLRYAFEWKDKYGGIILDQLKKLGASCDWDRTRFTMEESLSKAVVTVFVDLYKKGKVYRGVRMTNWDPVAKTVLSNEEVIYGEENAQLFHLKYVLQDQPDEGIVIATQRPETIMADVAIAVHPEDERYRHLVGQKVLIPLINRPIPIIADAYVDREFGTGALKITPAHDQNDYELGQKHQLPVIDILTDDGRLNEAAQILVGEDRFDARKKIRKLLEEAGALIRLEDYRTNIGRSERTNSVVEPKLSLQWYLDMKDLARNALGAVQRGEVKFYPEHFFNMYESWLKEDNIRDWCISRQLWWGQQIPAWYYGEHTFVAATAEEALEQARASLHKPELTLADLRQDEDVVDTWFSSWLWPISVFDGFENQEELKYYYPTNTLVTGWDIIFFWVARMVMAGYEWAPELLGDSATKGIQPFHAVYFTGLVRDSKRRKMSKSLGNSPDALQLIENYGADGVRFGMLTSASAGNDIVFDAPFDKETNAVLNESEKCRQGLNFCNKLWNALRLVKGWEVQEGPADPQCTMALRWINEKFSKVLVQIDQLFGQYRLQDATLLLYNFIWDDFCSWYLEIIKPTDGKVAASTVRGTLDVFEKMMVALHPFMPFVTEELWHAMKDRKDGEDCIIAAYPQPTAFDEKFIEQVEKAKELVTKIRDLRNQKGLAQREQLELVIQRTESSKLMFGVEGIREMVRKMAYIGEVNTTDAEDIGQGISFLSGTEKYFLLADVAIDVEAERSRITTELEYTRGFVLSVEKKLSNERFVAGAPADVVAREQQKLADGKERIRILEESLNSLN